jgi:hypothetical protein
VVNGDNVYWTDDIAGTVSSVPLAGGPSRVLATGQTLPQQIALTATTLYWGNSGVGPQSMPIDGGTVTQIDSNGAAGVAVNGTTFFWASTTNGKVWSQPLGGGPITTVASAQGGPKGLAATDGVLAWADSTTGEIMSCTLSGGVAGMPVELTSGQLSPTAIAVDGQNVYWANRAAAPDGSIAQLPLAGGTPFVLAPDQNMPTGLAIDGTNLYWSAGELIKTVPIDGGAVVSLAASQNAPMGVAVDATSVYWCDHGSGTVMKVTPK